MSPRIKTLRKVVNLPIVNGFKPYGNESNNLNTELVYLLLEEYEALRLSDYENCNHHQASVMMCISRPTFTRIYASALQKIAKAFVEGKQIAIEGGKVYFDSDWYQCTKCNCFFNNPKKDEALENCPLCGNYKIEGFEIVNTSEKKPSENCNDFCICKTCGNKQQHKKGIPCSKEICSECGSSMRRKKNNNCNTLKHK